jgi:hypothetical protein
MPEIGWCAIVWAFGFLLEALEFDQRGKSQARREEREVEMWRRIRTAAGIES